MSKASKAFQRQALISERLAQRSADVFVSAEMRSLADAFRAQAAVMKKKRKKKK